MKKLIIGLLFLSFYTTVQGASPCESSQNNGNSKGCSYNDYGEKIDPCKDANTTAELGECKQFQLTLYGVRVEKAYENVLKQLSKPGPSGTNYSEARRLLIIAQHSWVDFYKNECMAIWSTKTRDSDFDYNECARKHTERRIEELGVYLKASEP